MTLTSDSVRSLPDLSRRTAAEPAERRILSVRGRVWDWPAPVTQLRIPSGVTRIAADVACRRGIEDMDGFFAGALKHVMPDPCVLRNVAEGAERLCEAVLGGERIAVLGDYDTDGATSTAMMLRWLEFWGADDSFFYIPDRIREGYGVNSNAVGEIARAGATLLVVVDSGTAAFEPIETARAHNIDVIVVDHHDYQGADPDAILINPKHPACGSGLSYMCSAGLTLMFLIAAGRAMRRRRGQAVVETFWRPYLALAALGTIADVVPLVGLNRAIVRSGLLHMALIPGLRALATATGERRFTTRSVGFNFAPCINAAGRIDDSRLGTVLLGTTCETAAASIAGRLVEVNKQRREIQREAVDAAMLRLERARPPCGDVVVVEDPSWHPGVVGLVASRIKDAFDCTAVAIGEGGKGSCRSIDGFDVGQAVIEAKSAGLLLAGGGHTAAAGLTVDPARIEELREFLRQRARGCALAPLRVDLEVPCGGLDPHLIEDLSCLEPFGQGNLEPRIALTDAVVKRVTRIGKGHLKLLLSGPRGTNEALLFSAGRSPIGTALLASEGRQVALLGSAKIDEFNGRVSAVLMPEDAILLD